MPITTFQTFHGWRGFCKSGGPLSKVVTIGFVTFGYMPWDLHQTLSQLTASLKRVLGRK